MTRVTRVTTSTTKQPQLWRPTGRLQHVGRQLPHRRVGIPQLSMHSVREMCGTEDIDICFRHFTAFYKNFSAVDDTVAVDR